MSTKSTRTLDKKEVWMDIPGYEGLYQLSTEDRVRSLPRPARIRNGGFRMTEERVLKQVRDRKTGYLFFNLCRDGNQQIVSLHRVKLLVYRGPCPEGMEACHNDGDPCNNNISNLRWDTHANNLKDRVRHGTDLRGKPGNRGALEGKTGEIRRLYLSRELSPHEIADKFGVTVNAIYHCLGNLRLRKCRPRRT